MSAEKEYVGRENVPQADTRPNNPQPTDETPEERRQREQAQAKAGKPVVRNPEGEPAESARESGYSPSE